MLPAWCPAAFDLLKVNPLLSLVFILLANKAHPFVFETSQQLPTECRRALERLPKCPRPNFGWEYKNLNETCCSIFKDEVFHCQSWTLLGTNVVFPACIRAQTIDTGDTMKLIKNTSGYPDLKINPCGDRFYEPSVRISNEIVLPNFCSASKHTCRAQAGEMELCKGTTSQDNRCICDHEHKPAGKHDCTYGFNGDSVCYCTPAPPCKAGTVRNITRGSPANDSCSTIEVIVGDYACVPETSLPTLTTAVSEGSTSRLYGSYTTTSATSDSPRQNIPTNDVKRSNAGKTIGVVSGGIVLIVGAVTGLIFFLKKFYPRVPRLCQTYTIIPMERRPQPNGAECERMNRTEEASEVQPEG